MTAITSDVKTVLGNKLHKLIKESNTVDAIATALASRRRIRGFTDITRLKMDLIREGFEIKDKEADLFFKELEKEGYGSMIYPRQLGGRARFVWKYDMRKVAGAAIRGHDALVEELPKHLQRISDASRKPLINRIDSSRVNKEEKIQVNKPKTKLNQMIINGKSFIEMTVEQYEAIQTLKDTLKALV